MLKTQLIVAILIISAISPLLAEMQGDVRNGSRLEVRDKSKPVKPEPTRIKELSGEVIIDGSLKVLETINGLKSFDLVEISTPVTPAANHARIFLRADGTKQTLVILYDDGTIDNIATNQ